MASATKKQGTRRKPKAPEVRVTLAKFDLGYGDPIYRVVRENVPIGEFVPLTSDDYSPRGGTPLRDATAQLIAHGDSLRGKDHVTILLLADESGSMGGNREAVVSGLNQFVDGMSDVKAVDPKAAGTVLAVIVTDGYENASHETDHATLAQMISEREADGWTMIFLGAAIDAWAQGASLGLSGGVSGQMVSYANTAKGTSSAMANVTTDAQSFLANSGEYVRNRSTLGAMRSVTEDGAEVYSNINAPTNVSAGVPNVSVQNFNFGAGIPYADADEAIKKAKKVTS